MEKTMTTHNARGLDSLWGMYQWLDRAPRGTQRGRTCGGVAMTSTATPEPPRPRLPNKTT